MGLDLMRLATLVLLLFINPTLFAQSDNSVDLISCIDPEEKTDAHAAVIHIFKSDMNFQLRNQLIKCLNNLTTKPIQVDNAYLNLETSAHLNDDYVWYELYNRVEIKCDKSSDFFSIKATDVFASTNQVQRLIEISGKISTLNGFYTSPSGGSYSGGEANVSITYSPGSNREKKIVKKLFCESIEL